MRVRPATFALADLDRMMWAGYYAEAWLLHDEDLGWSWWARIQGDEDIVAYARRRRQ